VNFRLCRISRSPYGWHTAARGLGRSLGLVLRLRSW
jgi:hypothetical protein